MRVDEIIRTPFDHGAERLDYNDVLQNPEGLEVRIEDPEVLQEVANQVSLFRVEALQCSDPDSVADQLDRLSDVASLFVLDSDFETLSTLLEESGLSDARVLQSIDRARDQHQLRIAHIFNNSIARNDIFIHRTPYMPEILKTGSLKTRFSLIQEGVLPVPDIERLEEQGYSAPANSLLVHFQQQIDAHGFYGDTSAVIMPAQALVEKTPVLISGQDEVAGLSRIRGSDEAHTESSATRYEFAPIQLTASEEFLRSLPDVPVGVSNDVTAMPANPTIETAGGYEYQLDQGVGVITNKEALRILEPYKAALSKDDADLLSWLSASQTRSLDDFKNYRTAIRDVSQTLSARMQGIEPPVYMKPGDAETCTNIMDTVSDMALDTDTEQLEIIAQTALFRYFADRMRINPELTRSVIVTSGDSQALMDLVRANLAAKCTAAEGTIFMQYKEFELGFTQADLVRASAPKQAA